MIFRRNGYRVLLVFLTFGTIEAIKAFKE